MTEENNNRTRCVCGDSKWAFVGHCPERDHGEYSMRPKREGLFPVELILPGLNRIT